MVLPLWASLWILLFVFGHASPVKHRRDVFSSLPFCTVQCSQQLFPDANCTLSTMPQCLCPSVALQRELYACTIASCNATDEKISLMVLQTQVCEGVPQESRSAEIRKIVIIITATTIPMLLLRIISRHLVVAEFWYDDWVLGGAAIVMLPMAVISIIIANKGFGRHIWDLGPNDAVQVRLLYWVAQILYVVVQTTVKLSILLLYLRVFPESRIRIWTKVVMLIIVLHVVAFGIVVVLQCVPIHAIWDLNVRGQCVNEAALIYAGAGFSITEDLVIIALPIPVLWGLRMGSKKKLALTMVFAVGSFAGITSIIRIKFIVSSDKNSIDSSWENVDLYIWSMIEIYTATMTACLMTLKPLFSKLIMMVWPVKDQPSDAPLVSPPPSKPSAISSSQWLALE